MSGTLYLCSTPIGNLDDITLRVLNLLKTCDLIAAEDTRHTLKLLNHFQIQKPLFSYHEHNKGVKGPILLEKLKEGQNIVLVSDAGMPGISDPGQDMVRLCHENQIPVTVAPGANAALTALVLSGFDSRQFVFEGFLPAEKKERSQRLHFLEKETRTMIFYEAPHRLMETLDTFDTIFGGERCISCVRELTKKYEEIKISSIKEQISYWEENPPKGEFVLIVEGYSKEVLRNEEIASWQTVTIEDHLETYLSQGMSKKEAMKAVAKDRGVSKREIYQYLNKDL